MAETGLTAEGGQLEQVAELPIDPGVTFTDKKGRHKKGIEKRQRKLLGDVAGFVKPFLQEGEVVHLVATGCSPMSMIEQLVTGWIVFYLKRALLIVTNRRIIHVPTTSGYGYRNSIAEIPFGDCAKLKMSGSALVVKYKSGKTEKFFYVSKEKAKLKALLPTIALDDSPASGSGRIHLCPRCTQRLVAGRYECPNCQLSFKSKAEARRLALLYPGGGYFYTGHPLLGIGDALAEVLLGIGVIAALVDTIQGGDAAAIVLVYFGILLVVEKAISVFHSNHYIKEYIPRDKHIEPLVSR